ncbi:hypothetical protein ACOZ4B_08885 [Haloferax prahovense]|uniref:hypothetical protein n=1 Tax=Haloferax prahovense TaxID=381852 RepID=UPI003C70A0E2
MSSLTDTDVGQATPARDASLRTRIHNALFGDQIGLLIFLVSLVCFGLTWRVGFLINDNYTIANALYNLANGSLHVETIVFGPESGITPGMVTNNGNRYGRNYGQLVLSLPFVYLFRGLAAVGDLRLGLVGLWSVGVLLTTYQLGRLTGRETTAGILGSVLAILVFGVNTAVATELSARWISVFALQTTSMIATAFVAVLLYRLLMRIFTPRVGIAAAAAIVVATPLTFWATIPKRHTYMAALVVAMVYSFYRSRDTDSEVTARRFRALAYAVVGLAAWLQAGEALVMLVALGLIDLLTAKSHSVRDYAVIGGVFILSLLPFMLTNLLVAGTPFKPPLFLPRYSGPPPEASSPSSGTPPANAGGTADAVRPIWERLTLVVGEATGAIDRFVRVISRGAQSLTDPLQLSQVFIRSGYIETVASRDKYQAINLSLLESLPLAAGLVLLPKALVSRARSQTTQPSAVTATDWLAVTVSLLFLLFYLPRLPLHAMITVRYLLPVMPLFVYGVFRFATVHSLLQYRHALGFAYAGTVLIGSQLLVAAMFLMQTTLGESIQIHAWIHLGVGGCFALWVLVHESLPEQFKPGGAVLLGGLAGVTTSFLLLASFVYFTYEAGFVLPLLDLLSGALNWL